MINVRYFHAAGAVHRLWADSLPLYVPQNTPEFGRRVSELDQMEACY